MSGLWEKYNPFGGNKFENANLQESSHKFTDFHTYSDIESSGGSEDEEKSGSSLEEGEDSGRELGGDEGQTIICGLPKRLFLLVVLLSVDLFIVNMMYSLISPFFPLVAKVRQVPDTMVGVIFALYPLMVFIFSPIVGKYLTRLGVRNVFLVGLSLLTVGTGLFAFVDATVESIPFIIACCLIRLIQGFGAAFVETSAFAALTVNCPPRYMGKVFAALETAGSAGALLGPPIGGVLYEIGGFKLPFLLFGPFPVVIAIAVILLKFEMEMDEEEEDPPGVIEVLKIPWVWISCVVTILTMSALVFIEPTLAIHLQPFELSPTVVGLMFVLTYAVYMVATPVVGYLIDHWSKSGLMFIGVMIMGSSYLLLGPAPFLPFLPATIYLNAISLGLLGVGSCVALLPTLPMMCLAAEKKNPNSATVVSGIASSAYSLGEVIGPPLGSTMVDLVGFEWASAFFAGLVALSGILILVGMFMEYREKAGEQSPLVDPINQPITYIPTQKAT